MTDYSVLTDCSDLTDWSVLKYCSILSDQIVLALESYRVGGGGWVYLDYSVSSGPFLRFSMRFEFLSEMFDHSVCESRDPSLTIFNLTQPKDEE